jgi:hypothetical protein
VDIVYICRDGENEELRYSIRSVMQNLPHDNLWVVGGRPNWYKGAHIPVIQNKTYFLNAKTNMRRVLHSDQISDKFILMNDDFFVMQPVEELQYMYSGLLLDKIQLREKQNPGDLYTKMLLKTYSELYQRSHIKQPLDYELHVPMMFEKEKLSSVIGSQGLWRSMYGNIYNVGGEQFTDTKIYNKDHVLSKNIINIESKYLSTEDKVFEDHKQWFNKLFSKPSKFEN